MFSKVIQCCRHIYKNLMYTCSVVGNVVVCPFKDILLCPFLKKNKKTAYSVISRLFCISLRNLGFCDVVGVKNIIGISAKNYST